MLLTVTYVCSCLVTKILSWRRNMRFLSCIRSFLLNHKGSIVLRKVSYRSDVAAVNGAFNSSCGSGVHKLSPLVDGTQSLLFHSEEMLRFGRKVVIGVQPQQTVDLSKWTAYLSAQNLLGRDSPNDNECRVLLEVLRPEDEESFLERSFSIPSSQKIKVTDISTPLAWKSGVNPFGIVLSCTEDNFVKLYTAFFHGYLVMDEILEIQEMISITTTNKPQSLIEPRGKVNTTFDGLDSKADMKPPNVLIYCGKRDSSRSFLDVKQIMSQCVDTSRYALYHLPHDQVKSTPWIDNTALLVIACERLYDGVDETFFNFYKTGGKVLNFGSTLESLFLDVGVLKKEGLPVASVITECGDTIMALRSQRYFTSLKPLIDNCSVSVLTKDSSEETPVVVAVSSGHCHGKAILSQILLEKEAKDMAISAEMYTKMQSSSEGRRLLLTCFLQELGIACDNPEPVTLTPAYMFAVTEAKRQHFINEVLQRRGSPRSSIFKSTNLTIQFGNQLSECDKDVSSQFLPVIIENEHLSTNFNMTTYAQHLSTHTLGQVVLYSDVVPSTMNITDTLLFAVPSSFGLVVIADRQTRGKGRGGNAWLSPKGCAQFTVNVHIPLTTRLGSRASLLQHLAGLAVVKAVRSLDGYEDIHIRQKWPNDIYFSDQIKIGGILVKATVFQGNLIAQIGIGVNVSNSLPTTCLNDIIAEYSQCHGIKLQSLTSEQVIARTLSCLEQLIDGYEADGGQAFLEEYYRYWLHSGVTVKVECEGDTEGEIIGLDDYGFLLVKTEDGRMFSVQSDGNTFDMMRNLIVMKRQ